MEDGSRGGGRIADAYAEIRKRMRPDARPFGSGWVLYPEEGSPPPADAVDVVLADGTMRVACRIGTVWYVTHGDRHHAPGTALVALAGVRYFRARRPETRA